MRCPKDCPNKFCKALYPLKERESIAFDFCKPKKKTHEFKKLSKEVEDSM